MQSFQDPISKLFCVTFDNSSVKDKFYSSIKSLNETIISSLFKNYIDKKIKVLKTSELIEPGFNSTKNYYFVGDGLKMEYTKNNNITNIKNSFYMFNPNTNGECVRNEPLLFMKNIPMKKCSKKFVKLNNNLFYYLLIRTNFRNAIRRIGILF